MKRRYVSIVLTKSQLLRYAVLAVLILAIASSPIWFRAGARLLAGVEPGVTLAGVSVGGKLESEVRALVEELAKASAFLPRDAALRSSGDEVMPAASGRYVDVGATIRRVMTAEPDSRVDLVTLEITPTVGERALQPIYQGPTDCKRMALTINVDWGQEVLPGMLQVLEAKDVKVTFFLTGRWAQKFPKDAASLAQAGHEIANHGLKHDHPKQLSEWDLTKHIVDNGEILRTVTGKCAPLYAPPYGEVDARIAAVAAKNGYKTIMWTIDTIDWQDPSPDTIVQRVVGKAVPGGIVLMHPKANTLKALPSLIDQLQAKGYELVTVSQLVQ